jgi:RNA polymerase sigma-70 factor (ECF subfamily)
MFVTLHMAVNGENPCQRGRLMSAGDALLRILKARSAAIIRKSRQRQHPSVLAADRRIVRPASAAVTLGLVTKMDLLRLKTLARLYARGLPPDVDWEDLLQEALTRVLVGARVVPADVPPVAFIAGVMRSLRSEHRRRFVRSRRIIASDHPETSAASRDVDVRDESALPERILSARQELAQIRRLFADDPVVLGIIDGLAAGLEPEQIRNRLDLTSTAYDTARRRMRRALLREGLASCLDK